MRYQVASAHSDTLCTHIRDFLPDQLLPADDWRLRAGAFCALVAF